MISELMALGRAAWFIVTGGDMPSEEERLKRIERNWDRLSKDDKKKYFDKTRTVEIVRIAKDAKDD